MIIQSSSTTLQATHQYRVRRTTQQQVRAWAGAANPPAAAATAVRATAAPATTVRATAAPATAVRATAAPAPAAPATAVRATAAPATAAPATTVRATALWAGGGRVPAAHDASGAAGPASSAVQGRLATIVALVEWLTGRPVQVLDPAELGDRAADRRRNAATSAASAASTASTASAASTASRGPAAPGRVPAGWGLEVSTTETTAEWETTAVTAAGSITTADGRVIDVAVDVQLGRETSRTSTSRLLAGDAAVTDPLMLSFTGTPGLDPQRTGFDLDGDGTDEQVPQAAAGNAFLVLDRNGNGVLDDGGELLGPATGDGFGELAAYDQDGNGWIDEADPVYARLGLTATPHGALTSLADQGVGAIGLAHVAAPFTFTSADRISGLLRSMGIWLGADGSAGSVQQIDLAT